MKNKLAILLAGILLGFTISSAYSDSLRIAQVDPKGMLLDQSVKLYLSVTDDQGIPLTGLEASNFSVQEEGYISGPNNPILSFQSGVNSLKGVTFLLLIDNSGSMYRTLEGEKSDQDSSRRIFHAKQAVKEFLQSMTNPLDQVGVAAYNKLYTPLVPPTKSRDEVAQGVDRISKAIGDPMYSEIYGSILQSVETLRSIGGRKVLIILSDGENRPSYPHSKEAHPIFGTKTVLPTESIEKLQREGISLFTVNFGSQAEKKDRGLPKISKESGGTVFNAKNAKELAGIYRRITDQVLKEYVITYQTSTSPVERRRVEVKYHRDKEQHQAGRHFFTGTLFGAPEKVINPLFFLAFFVACAVLLWLNRLHFEKPTAKPMLEVVDAGAAQVMTQIVDLSSPQTVIGSAADAGLTIAGLDSVAENHATVMFDEIKDQYTIVGDGQVRVNNQWVTTKILEPGDLINIDGVTMVFDREEK